MIAIVINGQVWAGKHTTCNRWQVASAVIMPEVIRDVVRLSSHVTYRIIGDDK